MGRKKCEHGKEKYDCRDCGGKGRCEHKKLKSICVECEGSQICEHKKRKSQCIECKGSQFCEHKKWKSICIECGGSAYCKHDMWKSLCKECGGSALCKNSWCETKKNPKCRGYCTYCFVNMFPDEGFSRNYKTKENTVRDYILERYPDFTWRCDKRIQDGCSLKRPDLMLDLGYQVIIIEIDENQHKAYDCSCENRRLMELSNDIGHRNLIFIRFNPDGYKTRENKPVRSCWKLDKRSGLLVISSKKSWDLRLKILEDTLEYWVDNETDKNVEVVHLFYDDFE